MDQSALWTAFRDVESWLDRRPPPPGLSAADQDEIGTELLLALVRTYRRGDRVAYPKAWARKLYGRIAGRWRRRHPPLVDGLDLDRRPAPEARAQEPRLSAAELWTLIAACQEAIERVLSPREREVLELFRAGLSIHEMARRTGLTTRAIRTVAGRITEKLRNLVPPPPHRGDRIARMRTQSSHHAPLPPVIGIRP